MVVFNYSGSEINAKIVYYGPALSGKTTNLEHIYERMPSDAKGKMVSMKTRTDRTLFFDFLPLQLGDVSGYRTRMLLYTVPGQVYYNATRKLVLKGVDAVVFVADSSPSKLAENFESLRNLEENLNELGLTLDTLPWAIQYNKRDLTDASPVRTLDSELNLLNVPSFEAIATQGIGVYETFQAVAGMLYNRLTEHLETVGPPKHATRDGVSQEPAKAPSESETSHEESVSEVVDSAFREVESDVRYDAPKINPVQSAPPPTASVEAAPDRPTPPTSKTTPVFGPSGDPEPVSPPSAQKETEDEKFGFAALELTAADRDMGRMIDLENGKNSDTPETGQQPPESEFITSPCRATAVETDAAEDLTEQHSESQDVSLNGSPEQAEREDTRPNDSQAHSTPEGDMASESEPSSDDECIITVPVLLSKSQIRKTIPIKLRLEIQITEEDL